MGLLHPIEHGPTRRSRVSRAWSWAQARYAALWTGITPVMLCALAVTFAAADASSQLAGDSLFPGAPLDEITHVLTTLLVLWAVGGALYERMLTPALIASVAIDLDHVPTRLGADWLTVGTPRPYTHSLLTVVLVLGGASFWRRRRKVLVGVAVGLLVHFWRDMAEPSSGVALLWPLLRHSFSLPHASYLLVMAVVVAAGMRRSLRLKEKGTIRDPTARGPDTRRGEDLDPSPVALNSAGTTSGDGWS